MVHAMTCLTEHVVFPWLGVGTDILADDTPHTGSSSPQGCIKSNYLQRLKNADRSYSVSRNKNMKTSMLSPDMSKYDIPKRQVSSRTIAQQRAEKSAMTIRSERSVLHGLSNTSDDGVAEIACTPSKSTSSILRTPEKSLRDENASLPSPPSGVKRSERIATRYQSKVIALFHCNISFCFNCIFYH